MNDIRKSLEAVLEDSSLDADDRDGPRSLRTVTEEFVEALSGQRSSNPTSTPAEGRAPKRDDSIGLAGQIITVRSSTDHGPRQLYSGLQTAKTKQEQPLSDLDGRRLPNGFDLTYPNTVDSDTLAPPKDKRTFGEVFKSLPKTKALELPRSTRNAFRSNVLKFVSEPSLERNPNLNRNDYKFQGLATGTWLNYSKGGPHNEQDLLRRLREKTLASSDARSAMMTSESTASEKEDPTLMFKKVFSSFAPTSDSSRAVVSEEDRDRQWWYKFGKKRLQKVFRTEYPDPEVNGTTPVTDTLDDLDIDEIVSGFAETEESAFPGSNEDPTNIDEVLEEVSQLLETVHSYQDIRNHDSRVRNELNLPTSNEFDAYELLRSQLSILVSSLPPFAVAKLDGDKLSDLNISTQIVVKTPDYRGTGQPDEYTQSRYRAANAASQPPAAATARTGQPTQPRQNYQTPNTFGRYGNNLTSYSQNTSTSAAGYGQRTNASYQTPGAGNRPYQNTSYQPATGSYSGQSNLGQYQRPTPNGYTNYGASQSQSGYTQTPTQPGYQQRAQSQAASVNYSSIAGRAASPQKPVVNGQYYGQSAPGR